MVWSRSSLVPRAWICHRADPPASGFRQPPSQAQIKNDASVHKRLAWFDGRHEEYGVLPAHSALESARKNRLPNMPRVTITVPDKTPQPYRFQLDRQSVTLGRGSENDIAIDCGSISVKHAEMLRVEGGYELRDLGSTNGIRVDGERKEAIRLRSGIGVKLGDVSFDFLLSDDELDILDREKPGADASNRPESPDGAVDSPPSKPEPGGEAPAPAVSRGGGGGGGGLAMILLFLILAAAAFLAGMAVRFQKETGGSLIDAINEKANAAKTSTPAPATSPAPPPPAEPAAGEEK